MVNKFFAIFVLIVSVVAQNVTNTPAATPAPPTTVDPNAGRPLVPLPSPVQVSFSDIASAPPSRRLHVLATFSNKVYLYGGMAAQGTVLSDLWRYDIATGTWREISQVGDIPPPRSHASSALVGDDWFVFGGQDAEGRLFNDMYSFNLRAFTWTKIHGNLKTGQGPQPRRRCVFQYHALSGCLYAGFGGGKESILITATNPFSPTRNVYTDMWKACPVAGVPNVWTWSAVPVVGRPDPRESAASGIISGNSLIVCGGVHSRTLSDTWVLNITNNTWTQVASLPYAVSDAGWFTSSGQFYVLGGRTFSEDTVITSTTSGLKTLTPYVFDPVSNTWTGVSITTGTVCTSDSDCAGSATCLFPGRVCAPSSRFHITQLTATPTGLVVLFGGSDLGRLGDTWVYNITGATWSLSRAAVVSPTARADHCSARVGSYMYIFGGKTVQAGTTRFLNDLWRIDITTGVWENLATSDVKPGRRTSMSCSPYLNSFFLFGGTDENGNALNEMFQFEVISQQWVVIPVSNIPPLFGHKMVTVGDALYIIGGQTPDGFSKSTYVFNPIQLTFTTLPSPGVQLAQHVACKWNDTGIFVFGGVLPSLYAYGEMTYIDTVTGNVTNTAMWVPTVYIVDSQYGSCVRVGDKVMIQVGHATTTFSLSYSRFFLVDPNKSPKPSLDEISVKPLCTLFILCTLQRTPNLLIDNWIDRRVGSTMETFGNRVVLFGGLGSPPDFNPQYPTLVDRDRYLSTTNGFDILSVCTSASNTTNCVTCSKGTYTRTIATGGACTACPAGQYSSVEGASQCTKCRPGSYNPLTGADDKAFCVPCPSGSYSDEEGAISCKPCTDANTVCPLGASSPIPASSYVSSNQYKQPEAFVVRTSQVIQARLITLYCCVALGVVLMLITLVLAICERKKDHTPFTSLITFIDLFSMMHTGVGRPGQKKIMFRFKTFWGGLLSLLISCLIVYFIVNACLPYFIDNVTEIRSIVPTFTYNMTEFKATFDTTVTIAPLEETMCVTGGANSTSCAAGVYAIMSGITGEAKISCGFSANSCNVKLQCKDCVVETNTVLDFHFHERGTYASQIRYHVSSVTGTKDDDNNDQHSELFGTFFSGTNSVFRGSAPTVFSLISSPTYYYNSFDDKKYHGYHVTYDSVVAGSTVQGNQFSLRDGVVVRIHIQQITNVLSVQRLQKIDPSDVISVIFGSLSGLVALASIFLVLFESHVVPTISHVMNDNVTFTPVEAPLQESDLYRMGDILFPTLRNHPAIVVRKQKLAAIERKNSVSKFVELSDRKRSGGVSSKKPNLTGAPSDSVSPAKGHAGAPEDATSPYGVMHHESPAASPTATPQNMNTSRSVGETPQHPIQL